MPDVSDNPKFVNVPVISGLPGAEKALVMGADGEIKESDELSNLQQIPAEGPFIDGDKTKLATLDEINAIADKATAYALTGVAVGTVYKTDDTGQVLEKVDHVPAIQQSFTISDAGSPLDNQGASISGLWQWNGSGYAHAISTGSFTHDGSRWRIQIGPFNSFYAADSADTVHPADATGWVTDAGTGTIDAVTVLEPRNWKHDGTILVRDNDEKQLLTNLPDTQQVNIVGEGGRIERFNGDGDGLNNGDFKILVNHPDNPVINSMAINGIYTFTTNGYYENAAGIILGDWGDGTLVFYTGGTDWQSSTALSATPDLVSTWTAVSTAAQGYAAMTSDMVTRLPAATASNWYAIKNTVYLTVQEGQFAGPFVFNGVTVGSFSTVGVGWVPVCEVISVDVAAMWAVSEINGDTTFQNEHTQTGTTHVFTVGTDVTLADCFPSGALVKIIN